MGDGRVDMVRIASGSSLPPHIHPPIPHVPSPMRDTFRSVFAIFVYSMNVLLLLPQCYAVFSSEGVSPSTTYLFKLSFATNLAPSRYIRPSRSFPSASMKVTEDKSTRTG